MALNIVRADIIKLEVDAIVNAANSSLLGGGGVDGAIHRQAGKELLMECAMLGGCQTGEAKITKGYNLPAKHVIHTVGPIYGACNGKEETLLRACYINSLNLAKKYELGSIAFPLISTGAYRFPKDIALKIAISSIGEFIMKEEMDVILTVFDKKTFELSQKLFSNISEF